MKDLRNVSAINKKNIRRDDYIKAINKWFYSTTQVYKSTVTTAEGNLTVNDLGRALVVGVYYNQNAEKDFLKDFDFQKDVDDNNITVWFPRRLYIYEKRITERCYKRGYFLPDFYAYDLTYHVNGFVFKFPGNSHLQNLLTPKENLLNEATPKTKKFIF